MKTLIAVLALSTAAWAEEYSVVALKEKPPVEVAEAIRPELPAEGHRILKGDKPYMDFWLRTSAPAATEKPPLGVRFGELKPWSFMGVVRVHAGGSDFKNQKYPAGVFTLRLGIQPEDGDHQGTAESRDFLLLSPAAADTSPETVTEKDAVKLSSKVNGRKHPIVMWLSSPDEEGKGPRIVRNDMKEHVLFETSIPKGAKDGKPVGLAIVVVGKAAEQ